MNYKECLAICRGRNRQRVRYSNSIHLNRYPSKITLDFYMLKNLITWYSNGWIKVKFHAYKPRTYDDIVPKTMITTTTWSIPWSDRNVVERFLPYNWKLTSYRYHAMIHDPDKMDEEARECPKTLLFRPDGQLSFTTKRKLGKPQSELAKFYIAEDRKRDKPRRRGRYWRARARNLYSDRSQCTIPRNKWWQCGWREARLHRNMPTTPTTFECGCRLYRKKQPKFTWTVQQILREPNATVRTSMIKIFGIEEFFKKVTASTLAKKDNYTLLRIVTGQREGVLDNAREEQVITALKMKCPSTGQIYINLVPDQCRDVNQALDWMFNIRNFSDKVGQQT